MPNAYCYDLPMHSQFLTVGGYKLHLLTAGQGATVLLLHGFAGSAEDWRPTAEALVRRGYRVVAADALGFGRSAKPLDAPYSFQLQVELYAGILDALKIERVCVMGHSMGGKYAVAMALLRPERVHSLVLVSSDGFAAAPPMNRAGHLPFIVPAILWLSAQPAVTKAMLSAAFVEPEVHVTPAVIARARTALLGKANWQALEAFSRRYDHHDLQVTGLRARLGEVRAPALLVWGDSDQVFPLKTSGRAAAAEIPTAQLVAMPRCGHFPQVEAARQFQGVLAGFLAATLDH